ncbi:MAG: glutaminyl-peptide cyclotransferase [Blastocatellia bacterium]|nr:glutaminyl-peptide cyclotransferase [Blastocatellia bacterium]
MLRPSCRRAHRSFGLDASTSCAREIYANIWHADRIARINPQTGAVVGWIDLTGFLARGEVSDQGAVLNGIAYNDATGRLFVTGKLWPKLFEIRLTRK